MSLVVWVGVHGEEYCSNQAVSTREGQLGASRGGEVGSVGTNLCLWANLNRCANLLACEEAGRPTWPEANMFSKSVSWNLGGEYQDPGKD